MGRKPLAQRLWQLVQSPRVIFVIALAMRLWAASQLLPEKAAQYFYRYNEFARIAWALTSGHGYSSPWANTPLLPTAVEPPVYTLLLAGVFKVAGAYSYRSLGIAIVINALFSSATAVLILQIGKRDFSPLVGVLASWTWSCSLYEAVVAIRLWESSLAALLLITSIFVLPKLRESSSIVLWVGFGVLAGVASLTNTTLLALFPCFWIWLWIVRRGRSLANSKLFALSIATFILVLVPWTVRNYAVFHRLMPMRDNFGLELWLGNHEGVGPRFDEDFPILNPTEYKRLGELRFMEQKRDIALQFIRNNPATFTWLSLRRIFRYWTSPETGFWLPMSLIAWLGAMFAEWDRKNMATPYLIVLSIFPLVYYATHTFNTYRHPIEPELLLLAAYALVRVTQTAMNRHREDSAI